MTDSTISSALLASSNKVSLAFPYQGGATAWLRLVRRGPDQDDEVCVIVNRGQLLESAGMTLRLDDQPATAVSASGADDGSTQMLCPNFEDSADFVASLLTAKKLMIQVTVFDQGRRVFEFRPGGLKWQAKAPSANSTTPAEKLE
jgi:hypothetical protein